MRFLSRALGLLLAAGAFVAFVIDGTRSIADNSLRLQSIEAVWTYLDRASLAAAQDAVQSNLSSALWVGVLRPLLAAPFFVLLVLLAALFLWLGRRPRSRIGYATRG